MDQLTTAPEPLDQLRDAVAAARTARARICPTRLQLTEVAAAARDAARHDLASFSDVLGRLLQVVLTLIDSDDTRKEAWQVRDFVRDAVDCLEKALQDDPEAVPWMAELCQQAEESWGDCLELIAPMEA